MKQLTLEEISAQIAELYAVVAQLVAANASRGAASARLLKPAEVADLFGYKRSQVYALMDSGAIPSIRLEDDGTRRIPLVALQALIAEHLKGKKAVDTAMLYSLLSK